MSIYICKCGRRVQKSSKADNTGNRLEGYGPGHECYGCPYAMPWGNYEWNDDTRKITLNVKGHECRMSPVLSYNSEFIGSIKDKCTCSVVSLDFDFLEEIGSWVKQTFTSGELTGGFSRDKIRATDYSHSGRYCYTLSCAGNKKGIAAKAALFARFFDPDGSRKGMTPQQEMEKVLTDIKNSRALVKEESECTPAQNADAAVTTKESAAQSFTAATPTTSASGAAANGLTPAGSPMPCASGRNASVGGSSAPMPSAPGFDFGADDETNALLLQDAQTFITGNMARIMAAKHAHDLCANNKNGTWGKWCDMVGISRDTGDNMVHIAEQFGNIQIDGQSIFDVRPMKLLYAAAKPSTPQEIKEAVFSGDITTYKEYQDVMAQLKAKEYKLNETQARLKSACIQEQESRDAMNTANAQLEAANADIKGLTEQNNQLKSRLDAAEARKEEAEKQLEGSRQVAEAAKRRADKWQAEAEAARKQPIEAVVDEEEVERRANQKAHDIAEDLAADMTADLREQLERATSGSEQEAHSSYDAVLLADRSFQNIGKMVVPSLRRLPPEQREQLTSMLVHTLGQIQGEVSRCL